MSDKVSQSVQLVNLLEGAELFHDFSGNIYATIKVLDHRETWDLHSKNFQSWLTHQYWKLYQKVPNRNALQDAINTAAGKARYSGRCYPVFIRVGFVDNEIYIHLGDAEWRIIQVTRSGWSVVTEAPIRFKGAANMMPLPLPVSGGDIDQLWEFANVSQEARCLVLAWLLESLRPQTPYPVLILTGLQGSAKSTTQSILSQLIDPSVTNLRSAPKKAEDLFVAAHNNYLLSYNNLSYLSFERQDELCCLSTGGGFATRKLYTTAEEEIHEIKRPVILNGISDFVVAQDLIDRAIILELPQISDENRLLEQDFHERFNKVYPLILGALLSLLAKVLAELPNVQLEQKPRMADFALLGVALERVLALPAGSFMRAYQENRANNILVAMEASPVVVALEQLIHDRYDFEGTWGNLFKTLSEGRYRPASIVGWPTSAKGLSNVVMRQIPALQLLGITVIRDPSRQKDGYHVKITKMG